MRLINIHTLDMKEFVAGIPPYAILSHRWTDDEITLKEFRKRLKLDSVGYKKLIQFCKMVKRLESARPSFRNVEWVWIDTCCIDKRSSAELSEAINSMFNWYWNAEYCVAYLSDVSTCPATDDTSGKLREDL